MRMIDFDIASKIYNASKISHNEHSTSLFSLTKVTGDYSVQAKCHVIQLSVMYVLCKLPLYTAKDWFCHVLKRNKHPEVCVCGVRVSCLLCH